MDPVIELTNALADLEQQLRMRKLTDEHQTRVTTQVRTQLWQPYASMDYDQYGGTPYLSNHNFGWSHHPNTSWNTSYNTLQSPQVQRSSLEEAMDELRRTQVAFTKAQPEFSRSMDEMDYSQVGLPQFFNPNEISKPPHERMTKLEAALIEMKRVHAECVTPQTRGSVDYPSTRGIQVDVGLPDATSENQAESPLYGELYPNETPA